MTTSGVASVRVRFQPSSGLDAQDRGPGRETDLFLRCGGGGGDRINKTKREDHRQDDDHRATEACEHDLSLLLLPGPSSRVYRNEGARLERRIEFEIGKEIQW